jgi:hypothetical protein
MTSCTGLTIDTTSKVITTKYVTAIPSLAGTGFSPWLSHAESPAGTGFSLGYHVQTISEVRPASYVMCSGDIFPGLKRSGRVKIKNVYSFISTHPLTIIAKFLTTRNF